MSAPTPRPLLVVGAGIAGVTAAIEAAEAGRDVVLLEKEASIGGRVLQLHPLAPQTQTLHRRLLGTLHPGPLGRRVRAEGVEDAHHDQRRLQGQAPLLVGLTQPGVAPQRTR